MIYLIQIVQYNRKSSTVLHSKVVEFDGTQSELKTIFSRKYEGFGVEIKKVEKVENIQQNNLTSYLGNMEYQAEINGNIRDFISQKEYDDYVKIYKRLKENKEKITKKIEDIIRKSAPLSDVLETDIKFVCGYTDLIKIKLKSYSKFKLRRINDTAEFEERS